MNNKGEETTQEQEGKKLYHLAKLFVSTIHRIDKQEIEKDK